MRNALMLQVQVYSINVLALFRYGKISSSSINLLHTRYYIYYIVKSVKIMRQKYTSTCIQCKHEKMIAITYYSHHISQQHFPLLCPSQKIFRGEQQSAEERKKTPDASNVNEIVLSWKLIFLCETHFFRAIAVFFASKGRRLHYSYSSLSICKRSGIILEEAFG